MTTTTIIETMEITKSESRAKNVGGTWVEGTFQGYQFQALVFNGQPENPEYAIGDSRISKLWVRREADRFGPAKVVVDFDRGWNVVPKTIEAKEILCFLRDGLADYVCWANAQFN